MDQLRGWSIASKLAKQKPDPFVRAPSLNESDLHGELALPRTDDATFLRRACVDLAGRLPRAEEVVAFLKDDDPGKRAHLTDSLLAEPGAGEVRFRILAEAFRVRDQEAGVSQRSFISWLRKAAAEDMPFPDMVKAMITAQPGSAAAGLLDADKGDQLRTACCLADALAGQNLYCPCVTTIHSIA